MTKMPPLAITDALTLLATGDQRPLDPNGALHINGTSAQMQDTLGANDVFSVGPCSYRVVQGLGQRLVPVLQPAARITRPVRLQAGLHKCLTMFQKRVYTAIGALTHSPHGAGAFVRRMRGRHIGYKHCFHAVRRFYKIAPRVGIASLSGQAVDLDQFDDIRAVRFIRDPRDLLISGYYFHRRGAENINKIYGPKPGDFAELNAGVPEGIADDERFFNYLQRVDMDVGLDAEMCFRAPHFLSMCAWAPDDPRVLTIRYEDFIGAEAASFHKIADHFEWSNQARDCALRMATEFAQNKATVKTGHVRNKAPGQWRAHFSPERNAAFVAEWGDLLRAYDYPLD
ncbi:sulfotransferase domain-containing protein [Primorskyibacter sp. S187A]|uniref:sulfotransferase domain-containing protein n=1 Tax=Primorskyibacter sp. S187A TaxID=3415130 RepID=UPI003C7C3657